ncbi:single-stranded DNA-binding protein [Pengzhenrongella sicca]|uniref:Single-stranded DNA-binding protein n=1 Tax=Pengzhenrongella sicca TaxID=2819238 RepID=A0A8A4ZIV5_9MICO|nr:single-stranded DNA-binding protein [Pengzhenrongella sicca]QTE30436.1 single-stranded DNA-binding protein [Pengzhenrongella sicca]
MSTSDLNLTLVGWVATGPKLYSGPGTTPFTSFRMASTRRHFDRVRGSWVDGRTEWFTVKCWRQQARNVAETLRKSDPVIVTGRLATQEWTGPDGTARTTLVLDALAIGPDLTFGSAKFARTMHVADAATEVADQPEPPANGQDGQDGSAHGDGVDGDDGSDDGGVGFPALDDPWAGGSGDGDLPDPAEDELGSLSAARSIT